MRMCAVILLALSIARTDALSTDERLISPAVLCSNTGDDGNIGSVISHLLPHPAQKFIDIGIRHFKKTAIAARNSSHPIFSPIEICSEIFFRTSLFVIDSLEQLALKKIPLKHLFGSGMFNISVDKSTSFLSDKHGSIQLVEHQNLILSWMCMGLFQPLEQEQGAIFNSVCTCSTGERLIGSVGDIRCVVHPCSSADVARGWCLVEVNPLRNICIHSNVLKPIDITYGVFLFDLIDILPVNAAISLPSLPLRLIHFVAAFFLLTCPASVMSLDAGNFFVFPLSILFLMINVESFWLQNDSTVEPGFLVDMFTMTFGDFEMRIWNGELCGVLVLAIGSAYFILLYFHDSCALLNTETTAAYDITMVFRIFGFLSYLYLFLDLSIYPYALLLLAVASGLFPRRGSCSSGCSTLIATTANQGIQMDEYVRCTTVSALGRLRNELERDSEFYEKIALTLKSDGKNKIAHLLRCFRDGSFSGLPYGSSIADRVHTKKSALKEYLILLLAISCISAGLFLTQWPQF